MRDDVICHVIAGVLRRIATRPDDVSIDDAMITIADELIEGADARDRGETHHLTMEQVRNGQFIGNKK